MISQTTDAPRTRWIQSRAAGPPILMVNPATAPLTSDPGRRSPAEPRVLHLELPSTLSGQPAAEFFLGAWRADGQLYVRWTGSAERNTHIEIDGGNWFMLSSRSPVHADRRGLIHASADSPGAIAFRGYIVEPAVHTWSDAPAIIETWLHQSRVRPNGVFAMARVTVGHELELRTDAFGMAPLYYRTVDDLVLFATSARFLALAGDQPDLNAWVARIAYGSLFGDRSLTDGVQRVPPATTLTFSGSGISEQRWYDYADLPGADRPIDGDAVAASEQSFQTAMDRCLGLAPSGEEDAISLPLSSGYDSRRILAGLLDRKARFKAMTVRVYQQQNRDLDATFAARMAADLKFPHAVADLPAPATYGRFDAARQRMTDGETAAHTWALALQAMLPNQPSIVFDGLAGDVFGETGFEIPELHDADEARVLDQITHIVLSDQFKQLFAADAWPAINQIRQEIHQWLLGLPAHHRADLAFLLSRTRRSIALFSQTLLPAGHVPVYPYLDLDYVATTMQYDPRDKLGESLQSRTLARFWPAYHRYSGSRSIPADMPPGPVDTMERLEAGAFHATLGELKQSGASDEIRSLLSLRFRTRYLLSQISHKVAMRSNWWLKPIMELLIRQATADPVWEIVE